MNTSATIRHGLTATLLVLSAAMAAADGQSAARSPQSNHVASAPRAASPEAFNPYETTSQPTAQCEIDRLVLAHLKLLHLQPAPICSDAVFLRRVYLDVIGVLPTVTEAQEFLRSTDPNKRSALIDRLLEREEFADYWAMKWSDVLRVKAEFPINLWPKAAQAYHRWIRTCIKDNRPYDQFAREMLLATGSNFYVPPANFYRAMQNKQPQGIAQAVALTFMGERADKWPKQRLESMGAFFQQVSYKSTAEWKEEIVYLDPVKPSGTNAIFPDSTTANIAPAQDAREVFVDWLVSPKNPWFARHAANRTWYWLMGRGIIHEPDDVRSDNPPQNPQLLAYLERELISSHYDLKRLYRLILNSQAYQLSSVSRPDDPRAAANFAAYPVRQIEAEVLADMLTEITGTGEKYSSPVPEPFTYVPEEEGTTSSADGNTSSAFLELFGRPARDTGLLSERTTSPSAAQRLHLLNSSHVQQKIEQGRKLQSLIAGKKPREVVMAVYLAVLSRYPTSEELRIIASYSSGGPGGSTASSPPSGREALVDLVWALVNSDEFLYRH